jgi:phosphoenolpyruvate-protein kinase (PTS system EI component)
MNAGLDGIGVYRTELLFLVDAAGPGEDLLVHHYREVCQRAQGRPVSFRLLDLTSEQRVAGVRRPLDGNPALGLKGVRLLLAQPELMRLQIRALLRLAPSGSVDALVPFVTSVQEIYRVRETIRGERSALLKAGVECAEHIRIGAIIEVPAAAFHVSTVASEVDFLVVAVDDLQQYLLAADRDNLQVADYYRIFHPSLFRLLYQVQIDATHSGKELTLFGEGAADPLRLPFWIGAGYRSLAVSPVRSPHVRRSLGAWTLAAAQQLAERVLAAETSLEVQRILLEAER